MYEGRLNPVAATLRLLVSRQALAVTVLGATMAFVGPASADSSSLISQQDSIVANSIMADAQDCADGTKEGTIGHSIGDALKIHTELASATPNVESLFSTTQNCFSGLANLFDLSSSIPSLANIIAAAQAAVLQFAQKKVCSAVQEVTQMVTSPINQAIGNVSSGTSIGGLNGLTNGLVQNGMSTLDPQLGSSYHTAAPGTSDSYSVNVNPFNSVQTDFGGANTSVPVTTPVTAPVSSPVPVAAPAAAPSSSADSSSSSSSFTDAASNLLN